MTNPNKLLQSRAGPVRKSTTSIHMGALTFNTELARAHGWIDADIDVFWAVAERFMLWGNERAANRHPERYNATKDEFLGEVPRPSPEPDNG